MLENLVRQGLLDRLYLTILLQDLARDVEREVGTVDYAAKETKPGRKEFLSMIHDEHAVDIEREAPFRFAVKVILRNRTRNEEKSCELL